MKVSIADNLLDWGGFFSTNIIPRTWNCVTMNQLLQNWSPHFLMSLIKGNLKGAILETCDKTWLFSGQCVMEGVDKEGHQQTFSLSSFLCPNSRSSLDWCQERTVASSILLIRISLKVISQILTASCKKLVWFPFWSLTNMLSNLYWNFVDITKIFNFTLIIATLK